jgi:hypothetical protein
MRVLIALLSMLLASQSAAREVMVLDLTGPRPTSSGLVKMRSFSHITGVSHGATVGPPKWPVRTTLLDITQGSGPEQWIVEVRLEALTEVQLPRSLSNHEVDPDPSKPLPSYRQMTFIVELATSPGQELALSVPDRAVYGSHLAPGSLMTLQPGETVRVRYFAHASELIQRATPGMPISVRARVYTYTGSESAPALLSTNTLEVTPR